jgi:two-component system response regulator FlrC
MARVLVVEDEEGFRLYVAQVLEMDGHRVEQALDGVDALQAIERKSFDVVLTDLSMPRMSGMDLIRRLRASQPEVEIVVLTSHGSVEAAVEAMKLGAFDFVEKPLEGPEQITMLVRRAIERRRLLALHEETSRQLSDATDKRLSYGDPAMEPVERAIAKVAPTDATVLLCGESGTGKDVVARAIHRASKRAAGPFVVVNCATLPENLVEAELFGHEKGAFTGATERRLGRIEFAEGGTFFLDEVGELRPEVQAKLLRVLQDGCFEHIGGHQTISSDVRWIAATNRDLQAMMEAGKFREDLYHRLALFPIYLPPLRDRPADIVPLAEAILDQLCRRAGRRVTLQPSATDALCRNRWRGNVRELANALERALILIDGDSIAADDLTLESPASAPENRPARFEDAERGVLIAALEECGGSRRQAAKLLGIAERTLYDKMKRYNVR